MKYWCQKWKSCNTMCSLSQCMFNIDITCYRLSPCGNRPVMSHNDPTWMLDIISPTHTHTHTKKENLQEIKKEGAADFHINMVPAHAYVTTEQYQQHNVPYRLEPWTEKALSSHFSSLCHLLYVHSYHLLMCKSVSVSLLLQTCVCPGPSLCRIN